MSLTTGVTLAAGESLMTDADELIYRQLTEHLVTDDGRIATHAFTGPTSEGGMPSYARSTLVTAQDSRDWHTQNSRSPSTGVWAVTVGEVLAIRRAVIDDSAVPLSADEKRAPGHCYIDVRGLAKGELKAVRAALWLAATTRAEIPTREPLADGEFDLDGLQP